MLGYPLLIKRFRPLIGVIISKPQYAFLTVQICSIVSVPLSGLLFLNFIFFLYKNNDNAFPSPYRGYYF